MHDEASDPETYAIIGAAMAVHAELGPGFLESVCQEAMAIELERRGIPFQREVLLPVYYKGEKLNGSFRADFLCFGDVFVELKAQKALGGPDESQLLNYLKVTGRRRGLLFNFGAASLQTKRRVL